MRPLVPLLLLASACRSPSAAEPPPQAVVESSERQELFATPPESRAEVPDLNDDLSGAPASTGAISELLSARHAQDLPDRATLDAHADADEALAWLARNGSTAALRVRATRALGLFPDRDHDELLVEYARPTAPHPTLRAAALQALAALPVERRTPHSAVLQQALQSDDPRVVGAAREAAEGLDLSAP